MFRSMKLGLALAVVVMAGAAYGAMFSSVSAQRGAAPAGAPAAAAQPEPLPPPLLFREAFQQVPAAVAVPTSPRRSQNQYWLAGQTAITNPALELKLYGADAKNITVYVHEGRPDLWTGLTGSPVAVALKHRNSYLDLTGLARVRAMLRTGNLHVLHPMVRMADGALLAGTRVINTDGQFLMTDVSFSNLRWFTLEPETLAVKGQAMKVDLARVDEVGFVDLAPGGGHGSSGWVNISAIEVHAKAVPRTPASN